MSITEEPLEVREITDWLNTITHQLNQNLTGSDREEAVTELRRDAETSSASLRVLASLALLDDCLRVAHLAIEADGVVEDEEIARTLPLVQVAAPRYFALLSRYGAFGEVDSSEAELTEFLRAHRRDAEPFGNAGPGAWRGLRLCQRVSEIAKNDEPIRVHERMLARVMDAVFAGRASSVERDARDRLRSLIERRTESGRDPRIAAFCASDGPEVFSSVAHGSQIFDRDPFDVETIHADARAVFDLQVEHAITPSRHDGGHGRTLLVLGTAGSGKTHLLRAFRTAVHEGRLGYVGYLQMSSDVSDYSRYVLAKLIDSLERPYCTPELAESALLYLSDGLAEHAGVLPADQLDRLRTAEIDGAELPAFIGRMVDRLVRTDELSGVDSDLVQALLLMQRRDPALQRRVVKFLRCESLTAYEQELLGGLAPRVQAEDPERMIVQLGKLAFDLHQATLILLVDQIEDALPDARGTDRVQRAVDVVRRVADALPSSVVVIACLEDVYDQIRPRLHQSVIDRLERDPPPMRLVSRRSRDEIEAMLSLRLAHLYEAMDVAWRAEEPLFPFRSEHIDELANSRARDCLAFFRKVQEQCIAAGALVEPGLPSAQRSTPAPADATGDDFDRGWNDAVVAAATVPDDDDGLLQLLERGARACVEELGVEARVEVEAEPRPRLRLAVAGRAARVVEVCNRRPQGGGLASQVESLRRGVTAHEVPVALRTSEFAFGPKTQVAKVIGQMIADGGMTLPVEDGDLRAILAFARFAGERRERPGFGEWRSRTRPIANLAVFRKLFDLGRTERRAATLPGIPTPVIAREPAPTAPPRPAAAPPVAEGQLRLGVTPTMRAEPVTIAVESLKVHAAFLGTTGSGKTTIALAIVEQLLERGVSVLLVDRKGDLARYASPAWWDDVPTDAEAARRKRALRERVHVDLYTPGDASGRPLRIPVIPAGMREMTTQERDQVAKTAASGLAVMIGYGKGDAQRKREAILKKAIELHAETEGATLDHLRDTIARPDPELIAAVGNLTRHFGPLAEDLDMLAIQRGSLLSGAGAALDVSSMLAPVGGRTRLAIISAVALNEVSVLQFFVSRLLVELGRMVRRNPQPSLRAAAFFDEADSYIPAVSAPPTKDPMFDLLRRARSGGLGVLLATQNPGDLDYKARDNIATWLIGKVAQDRAIEKMRNLIGAYPNVASRLAAQATGSFFLLNPTVPNGVRELRADPALMRTEQLQEHEIAALARER